MPFQKPSDEELNRIADEVLAVLRQKPGRATIDPRGLSFRDIERTASAIGQRLATRLTLESLAEHAADQPEFAPCPKCSQSARLTRKKRVVQTPQGPVEYLEPAAHCLACRRDFFPGTPGIAPRRAGV